MRAAIILSRDGRARRDRSAHIEGVSLITVVTAPRAKAPGLQGVPPHSTVLRLKGKTSMQDIDSRIMIAPHHQPTMRTGMRAVTQGLGNDLAAARA